MVATSTRRVSENTAEHINRAIEQRMEQRLAYFAKHRTEIPRRLDELDEEWDVERALATGSSCLSLLGLGLGFAGFRRWFYLPLGVQGFYLQHALQGWCPPLPVFRRFGFRTPQEIESERCALTELLRSARGRSAAPSQSAQQH